MKKELINQMDKYAENKMQIKALKDLIKRNIETCSSTKSIDQSFSLQEMYLNIKYAKLINKLNNQNKEIINMILVNQEEMD